MYYPLHNFYMYVPLSHLRSKESQCIYHITGIILGRKHSRILQFLMHLRIFSCWIFLIQNFSFSKSGSSGTASTATFWHLQNLWDTHNNNNRNNNIWPWFLLLLDLIIIQLYSVQHWRSDNGTTAFSLPNLAHWRH